MAQASPANAAEVLIGHVDLRHDSIELRLLAQALVGDYPIRQRAVRFFNELPPEVRSLPSFQTLEGALHANIGVPGDAIRAFSAVWEQEPSVESLMYLIRAHIRAGDSDAITSLVQTDDVDLLPGPASVRMDLCRVLLDVGRTERALGLGYTVLVENLEESTIVRRFLELVLSRRRHGRDHDPSEQGAVVCNGSWVRLTKDGGHTFEALVGDSTDRPWGVKCNPSNEFIAKAIGRKEGECFEHSHPVTGATETWTVSEIRPFWMQAFRYLSGTFNQKLPKERGFASLTVKEGEIEPALDLVRLKSKEDRSHADLYLVEGLPMAFVASDRPGGSVVFAQYIASIGKDVRVCRGTVAELGHALRLIDQHSKAGAVIDALTAWHIAALEIFGTVCERLGPLSIPASELNSLKAMAHYYESLGDDEELNIGYHDGQFVRQIITAEQQAERLALVNSRIKVIEENCETEPLVVSDGLSRLGEDLTRTPVGESVAPAFLARADRLLLSEDIVIRELGNRGYGTRGVWLQAVALSAFRAGAIPFAAYVDVLVHLAAHRHGVVMFDADVIRSIYDREKTDDLVQIQALCNYIGNEDADPVSHTMIAADFINSVWKSGKDAGSRAGRAVGFVLTALLSRHRGNDAAQWVAKCYRRLDDAPRRYLLEWCKEHSVPVGALHWSRRRKRDDRSGRDTRRRGYKKTR